MQRLAIPQRIKGLTRRRSSLQPQQQPQPAGGQGRDQGRDQGGPRPQDTKRRSPSYDPSAPPFLASNPYRTHSAGDNLMAAGYPAGRRDSIFSEYHDPDSGRAQRAASAGETTPIQYRAICQFRYCFDDPFGFSQMRYVFRFEIHKIH